MMNRIYSLWGGRVLSLAFTVLGFVTCTHAAVTNVAWYRLGENDPGAASGQIVNSTTMDLVGGNNLNRAGSPHYTNDFSPDAAQIGSSLAVVFNGVNQLYRSSAVASSARDNFGIEAWGRTLTPSNGTYLITHNGNAAANGWGL